MFCPAVRTFSFILLLAVGCVPGGSDPTTPATGEPMCSLELTLPGTSDTFVLQSSEVAETTASYRIILRSSLREFNALVRGKLEAQGWQFAADRTESSQRDRDRQPNRSVSHYTCASDPGRNLSLSIAPVGRSLIYKVLLQLE